MTSPASSPRSVPASASTGATAPERSSQWASIVRAHGWEPLRIEGELPAGLQATVLRTGPGLMERFGRRLPHSFEADGVMTGLRLPGNGEAHGAVRVVEGPEYRAEEAAGKPLYGANAPWWRRFLNGLRGRSKATGNTSLMCWQGRVYALMEGARPLEIDPADLSTRGLCDFGGVLRSAFSAHPHRMPSQRVTLGFGVVYGSHPALALYALPDDGPARALGRVPLPWNTMVHDFALTERHAVFIVCPLELSLARALLALRDLAGLFSWKPELGAELLVVPLDDPSAPIRVPIEPRFVFHLANAHTRGDELVVDWVQYPNADVIGALSADGTDRDIAPSRLQRLVVDLGTKTLRSDEVLWDRGCDFPVLPARRVGQPYRSLWLMTSADDDGIARFDPESGALDAWEPGLGYNASEPMFVPRPHAERDGEGWLLDLVLDDHRGESFFGVFDAERPSAGPLAQIWMGQALPTTFHGVVLPRDLGLSGRR